MKILFLAKESSSSLFMYNSINEDFEINRVIFEDSISKKRLFKRRVKKLGLLKVIGQLIFQTFVVKILKITSKNRISEIVSEYKLDNSIVDKDKRTKVESINSQQCIDLIKSYCPDVIIVNGTRIISKKVLNSSNAIIINTHIGITPKYRGVHGGYWALTNNDIMNFGVTVHLIDSGIDTGDIVYQDKVGFTSEDNFVTYPYLQLVKGIQLMKKTLSDVGNNELKPYKNSLESKLWYHPTICQYLYYRVFKKVK